MSMLPPLKRLLDHLSATLDNARQAEIDRRYVKALNFEPVDHPPCVLLGPLPAHMPFKPYPLGETFGTPEKMLFNELVHAFDTSIALRDRLDDDLPLTVRAHFGTVLIASMFGAPVEQIGDNPPWVRHDAADISLEQIANTDPADWSKGWVPRVVETMEAYSDLISEWPKLKDLIRIVLPDLQGPFDNLELIRGGQAFLQLATEPGAVDAALSTLAAVQVNVASHLSRWTNDGPRGFCHQHAVCLKGNLLLRNDSCIMVSSEMYRRQIASHDEHVLRELGGGGIHSCGRVSHLVDEFFTLPSIHSLDFGQSQMNDVDAIYRRALEKRIALIRVSVSPEELRSGRAAARFSTGVVLICREG